MESEVDITVDARSVGTSDEDTVEIHIRLGRRLDRQIKEALLLEADRRGVRRVTVSEFVRGALSAAVQQAGGGCR